MNEKTDFRPILDPDGTKVPGLWLRGRRWYASLDVPGRGTRRIPLLGPTGERVTTLKDAVLAQNRLLLDRAAGIPLDPQSPTFADYVEHYLDFLTTTKAKSPLTIEKETYALRGWQAYFKTIHLSRITARGINGYAMHRMNVEKVSTNSVNYDVLALTNLLKFARNEHVLSGPLVTENWSRLKYVPHRRPLMTLDQIQAMSDEALSGKYPGGQFASDLIKFIAFSGARKEAALSACWDNVDFVHRQLTLFTKFDKKVVVDMNDKLYQHLAEMQHRTPVGEKLTWLFPSKKGHRKHPWRIIGHIATACGLVDFHLHDLRHFFISYCIMSGIDTLTVAGWVGHSDGGVLIGKVYGHLDPKHRRDAARQVNFES